MTILYREWQLFNKTTLEGSESNHGADWDRSQDWTTTHYDVCMIGNGKLDGPIYERWDPVFIPSESSFSRPSGMDEPCAFRVDVALGTPELNDPSLSTFQMVDGILKDPAAAAWDKDLCSGRYYDGSNTFDSYPQTKQVKGSQYQTVTIADLPLNYELWFPPGPANTYRAELFRSGYIIYASNWDVSFPGGWNNGDQFRVAVVPELIHIQYLNCVVNSVSPLYSGTAGGTTVTFTGLGFDNTNADIGGGWPWGGTCADAVDIIYFDGLQGQGTYTYTKGVLVGGQFCIDSNTQIRLMTQGMAAGTYEIRMYKQNVKVGAQARTFNITDYAGDWRCDADGRAYQEAGSDRGRFHFLVDNNYVAEGDFRDRGNPPGGISGPGAEPETGGPIVLTNWTFKDKLGNESEKFYAPIDVRASDRFYDGRIKGISSITRAIDDKTGAFNISDMTLELSNSDKEFSKILADYSILKNQIVELYHGWSHEPEAWKSSIVQMIVDDHSLKGDTFSVSLKDITQMYFRKKVPFYTCTSDEYANIHADQEGRYMPEVIGNVSLTTGEHKGAVEAVYVDTTTFEYLAARGSLKSVDQVYADDVLLNTPADYTIVYKHGGRTYIDCTGDQSDKKITYNAKGYMFAEWDDAGNAHVQNPAYVLAFFLAFIMEIPLALLNIDSFDDLAGIYTALGVDTAGRLIIQDERDAQDVLQELLFSFGAKGFIDNTGRFKVERKNIANYTSTLFAFDQVDLQEPADRQMNLNEAVNYVKPKWDYIPTHGIYKSATEESRQCAIDDFGAEMEPSTPLRFPWTDSSTLVDERITEELLKRGYGDQKIAFSLPIQWIDQIDIHTNFRFQDPYGISTTGGGEVGRYYYIESLSYDFQNNKIDVTAIDLQWLLRQYCIVGDETTLASNWSTAGEADRMYCYACDEPTEKFADGEAGKILVDENLL